MRWQRERGEKQGNRCVPVTGDETAKGNEREELGGDREEQNSTGATSGSGHTYVLHNCLRMNRRGSLMKEMSGEGRQINLRVLERNNAQFAL